MQSGLGTKQKNVEKMVKKIEEVAGNNDVDLIIFPELATTGYECSELYDQLAETYPEGESIKKIAAEAKKYKVLEDRHFVWKN